MATFYGQVFGNAQTSASRQGSKNSGIRTSAQSWNGSIIVELQGEEPMVTISVSDESSGGY